MIEKRAFSISEAAIYTGVSRSTIYRLVDRSQLILRKVAGRSVILRDDLDRYLENGGAQG